MTSDADRTIRYLLFDSPIGWLLAAATAEGLCLLEFCGPERPSDSDVLDRLDGPCHGCTAMPDPHHELLKRAREATLEYFTDGTPLPELPLDLNNGTLFQKEVWRALARIPVGETRSYGDIARAMGRPRSARAVGQACGKNPVVLFIPCHRVVASHGKLGGFGGGLHIKKALLKLEHGRQDTS